MGNIIISDINQFSINKEITQDVIKNLDNNGYCLIRNVFFERENKTDNFIENYILSLSVLIGQEISDCLGFYNLVGTGSDKRLDVHTEGIYLNDGIIKRFALGCIK